MGLGAGGAASLLAVHPLRIEALPAVADHRVSSGVRIGTLGELLGEQPSGIGRELAFEVLSMGYDRIGVVGIENLHQFIELRRLALYHYR